VDSLPLWAEIAAKTGTVRRSPGRPEKVLRIPVSSGSHTVAAVRGGTKSDERCHIYQWEKEGTVRLAAVVLAAGWPSQRTRNVGKPTERGEP